MELHSAKHYIEGIRKGEKELIEAVRSTYSKMVINYFTSKGVTDGQEKELFEKTLVLIPSEADTREELETDLGTLLLSTAQKVWQEKHAVKAHEDSIYIDGLRRRDTIVIQGLYKRFFPMIAQFVIKNNGTQEDARDIFQDALTAIYKKSLQADFILQCKFSTFLYEVARRLWLNQIKLKRSSEVSITEKIQPSVEGDIEASIHEREKQALYRSKFALLSATCQKALTLFFEGKKMKEIAEIMGFSEKYARKQKFTCKEQLTKMIQQDPIFKQLKE